MTPTQLSQTVRGEGERERERERERVNRTHTNAFTNTTLYTREVDYTNSSLRSMSLPSSLGSVGPAFTVGERRLVIQKKGHNNKGQHQSQQQTHEEEDNNNRGKRKNRVRISLKDRKTVHLHANSFGPDSSAADAADGDQDGVELSLAAATSQRRRIIEVRSKSQRDAELQARRHGGQTRKEVHAIQSRASGFDTHGGNRRALIVLPKSEEKMKAREMLMQMHPHIAQVFRGISPPDVFQQEPFDRILQAEAPTTPYRRRNLEVKTTLQWGERKLFLYELEFLTQYGVRPGTVVVYAGCAPATRIPFLASLLPHIQFVLVDPTPLDFDESEITNVQVRQLAFDDTIAREIRATATAENKTLLFIANATTDTPNGFIAGSEGEDYVDQHAFSKNSMDDQSRWHTILEPSKSLLKFSLPWTNDSTYYLDGDIILPVWNPPTSTEARLIPNTFHRTWSHRHYEEQMFHFNTVTRVCLHEHGVTAEGLDGCYDCTSEVFILERYLERYPHMVPTAVGSQMSVVPTASAPATQLKLDTTKFKDPEGLAKQAEKKAKFLITLVNDTFDGQPLTEEQRQEAEKQFDQQQAKDVEMHMEEEQKQQQQQPDQESSLAPASSSTSTDAAASAAGGDSMEDAAPTTALTPEAELKLNVGKFSQELSRRLTHGGTRTLATLNEKIIQKAAFSRKNRK